MEFDYSQKPVDKIASIVTSQSGCREIEISDKRELIDIIKNIDKKIKVLKDQLGIKNRRMMKNRKYYRLHPRQSYNVNKEKFQQLLFLGKEKEKLQLEIKKLKKGDN